MAVCCVHSPQSGRSDIGLLLNSAPSTPARAGAIMQGASSQPPQHLAAEALTRRILETRSKCWRRPNCTGNQHIKKCTHQSKKMFLEIPDQSHSSSLSLAAMIWDSNLEHLQGLEADESERKLEFSAVPSPAVAANIPQGSVTYLGADAITWRAHPRKYAGGRDSTQDDSEEGDMNSRGTKRRRRPKLGQTRQFRPRDREGCCR